MNPGADLTKMSSRESQRIRRRLKSPGVGVEWNPWGVVVPAEPAANRHKDSCSRLDLSAQEQQARRDSLLAVPSVRLPREWSLARRVSSVARSGHSVWRFTMPVLPRALDRSAIICAEMRQER